MIDGLRMRIIDLEQINDSPVGDEMGPQKKALPLPEQSFLQSFTSYSTL